MILVITSVKVSFFSCLLMEHNDLVIVYKEPPQLYSGRTGK